MSPSGASPSAGSPAGEAPVPQDDDGTPEVAPRPETYRHVVLVGLMGSGKSTIAKRVARRLKRRLVDADDAIVERTGKTVRELFAEGGEPAFRAAEAELFAVLLADPEPTVIAAGGGAVVTQENRLRLAAPDVFVVYLRADPAFLASRVKQKEHRPLLDDDARATLVRLAHERGPWYEEVADVMIDIESAHLGAPKPKDHLAERVVVELRAAEARR